MSDEGLPFREWSKREWGQYGGALLGLHDALLELLAPLGGPAEPVPADFTTTKLSADVKVGHLIWLVRTVPDHVRAGRVAEAWTALGFVEGSMWMMGMLTLEEIMAINLAKGV